MTSDEKDGVNYTGKIMTIEELKESLTWSGEKKEPKKSNKSKRGR